MVHLVNYIRLKMVHPSYKKSFYIPQASLHRTKHKNFHPTCSKTIWWSYCKRVQRSIHVTANKSGCFRIALMIKCSPSYRKGMEFQIILTSSLLTYLGSTEKVRNLKFYTDAIAPYIPWKYRKGTEFQIIMMSSLFPYLGSTEKVRNLKFYTDAIAPYIPYIHKFMCRSWCQHGNFLPTDNVYPIIYQATKTAILFTYHWYFQSVGSNKTSNRTHQTQWLSGKTHFPCLSFYSADVLRLVSWLLHLRRVQFIVQTNYHFTVIERPICLQQFSPVLPHMPCIQLLHITISCAESYLDCCFVGLFLWKSIQY